MKWSCSKTPSTPWYRTFTPSREGHLYFAWFSSQTKQISMKFSGHLFLRCLLVNLGQKIANMLSTSSCFLLICIVSICRENVCNIYLLKSSNILPISCLMVDVEGDELNKPLLVLHFFLSNPRVILEYCFDVIIRPLVDISSRKHVEGFHYILPDPSNKYQLE